MLDTVQWSPELGRQRHREFQRKIAEAAARLAAGSVAPAEPEQLVAPASDKQPTVAPTFAEITTPKKPWFWVVSEETKRVSMAEILYVVSEYFAVSRSEISSDARPARIVRPRQVCYWLMREYARKSLPEIGRFLGGRDHTSVMSGHRKIDRLRHTDQRLSADIAALEKRLGVNPEIRNTCEQQQDAAE